MLRCHFTGRWIIYGLLLAGLGLSLLPLGPSSAGANGSVLFPEGYRVAGRFLNVWWGSHSYDDSVLLNGYPISDERDEVSPVDGKTYRVQWFQRARYEYHPEKNPPDDVELSLLGSMASATLRNEAPFQPVAQPAATVAGQIWFTATAHTLSSPFLAFWQQYGGTQQFGYPISEQYQDNSGANGARITVQWFERTRFELQFDAAGQPHVTLGLLGVQLYPQAVPAPATASPQP